MDGDGARRDLERPIAGVQRRVGKVPLSVGGRGRQIGLDGALVIVDGASLLGLGEREVGIPGGHRAHPTAGVLHRLELRGSAHHRVRLVPAAGGGERLGLPAQGGQSPGDRRSASSNAAMASAGRRMLRKTLPMLTHGSGRWPASLPASW